MVPPAVPIANQPASKHAPARAVGNFSAGPACLPVDVLLKAQMDATKNIRTLLEVPSNYQILWMQSGAHGQFSALPLNLLGKKTSIDFVSTGFWSERAYTEASKYCDPRYAYDGKQDSYSEIPPVEEWEISNDSAYVHICANETIHGLEFLEDPELPPGSPPLVADFTSTLLSRTIDVSKYGCIYASGGKNLGPAGVTCVIIREDMVGLESENCPSVLSYAKMVNSKPISSIYNTPPTYLIYMVNLVLQNNLSFGGISFLEERAKMRSLAIYALMDDSAGFYVPKCYDFAHRSRMNVPFRIGSVDGNSRLEEEFCSEAEKAGLLQLFCHPLFPGCRITLYNGIPDTAVEALVAFMKVFADKYADSV